MAATAFPPQNKKAAISPCKNFLFVCRKAIAPQGTKNKRPPRCIRHDKSGTEAVEKKSDVCRQGWLWAKAKPPMIIFPNGFAFANCHARFFSIAGVQLLAWLMSRGHKQKVLAHRFYLVPCRRMARFARWLHPCDGFCVVGGFYFNGWCSFKLA
jgi:hypothetical protein